MCTLPPLPQMSKKCLYLQKLTDSVRLALAVDGTPICRIGGCHMCHGATAAFSCVSLTSFVMFFRFQGIEPAKYLCHICSKRFYRGARLTTHLKKIHRFKWPSGHTRFRYKKQTPHATLISVFVATRKIEEAGPSEYWEWRQWFFPVILTSKCYVAFFFFYSFMIWKWI